MKPSSELEKSIKGQEKFLVLEVGNYNTKLVEVVPQSSKMIVTKGFIFATPEGTIEDDVVVKYDELISGLKERIAEEKISTRSLTISLSSKDIITREMNVPQMNKKDTLSFIKLNAKDLFPVDLSDYTLGYVSMEKTENSPKLLILAIPNEIIIPYIEICKQLNLILKGINFSGFELYNFVDFELGREAGNYAVIDIGSKNTNFIIVSKGMLMYNRVIKIGSDDITQAIADRMKCTLTKGEKIKREFNSVILEGTLKPTDDVYVVANIIRDVIGSILDDISTLIEFYNTNHSKQSVSKVYIIGLAAKISGISEFVESILGIPTEKIREFERVTFDEAATKLKGRQVTLENCLGAIPIEGKRVCLIRSNLQLNDFYQSINPEIYKFILLGGCIAILVLCIINFGTYLVKEDTLEYARLVQEQKEVESLQNTLAAQKAELAKVEKIYDSIPVDVSGETYLLDTIDEIVKKYTGVTVTNYSITKPTQISITCSIDNEITAYDFIGDIKNKFDGAPSLVSNINSVKLNNLTLKQQ